MLILKSNKEKSVYPRHTENRFNLVLMTNGYRRISIYYYLCMMITFCLIEQCKHFRYKEIAVFIWFGLNFRWKLCLRLARIPDLKD